MKKFFNRALWSLLTSFFAVWLAIALIGEAYALQYASTINNILNINPYEVVGETDPEPIFNGTIRLRMERLRFLWRLNRESAFSVSVL